LLLDGIRSLFGRRASAFARGNDQSAAYADRQQDRQQDLEDDDREQDAEQDLADEDAQQDAEQDLAGNEDFASDDSFFHDDYDV
jgi:hypothetical protein